MTSPDYEDHRKLLDPFNTDFLGEPGMRFATMAVLAAAQLWHDEPTSDLRAEMLHASVQLWTVYLNDLERDD